VLAYAALIASSEFFFSRISPHGTLGSVAYSQGDVPTLLQLASLTGIWGISFVVSIAAAGIATAWRHRGERTAGALSLCLGLGPAVAAVIFGIIRLATATEGDVVRVGLAASDVEAARQLTGGGTDDALQSLSAYTRRVLALAEQGARFIVLPEKFVRVTSENREHAIAILGEAARNSEVTIVAGWLLETSAGRRNVAVVFDASGHVVLEYAKQHLVPGIEHEYLRGNAIGLLDWTPTIGVAICKDLDFPALGRSYARAGVGMLLVPAWDFGADRWIHSRMAILRSIEGGYAMVRTATDGLLTVTDRYGRVLAERASDESAEVLFSAMVPARHGDTFYNRSGDWFGWLCLGVVGAALSVALLRGPPLPKRLRPSADGP
jgi:apolipoprotein N-acyltransferase